MKILHMGHTKRKKNEISSNIKKFRKFIRGLSQ